MITKNQHEELIVDYEKFNQFLELYTEQILQRVYLEVPSLLLAHIEEITKTKKLRDKFYEKYDDLKDHQQLLGQTVNSLQIKNPSWTKEKLFDEAGKLTRQLLSEETNSNGQGF
jgi:hypothetical protein